ncbi:hypothetical protein LNP17_12195 [Klebsiella variicola subsp. variicola]|nr:hypothetical protein [Klebsiella variicola subsp. variicola]
MRIALIGRESDHRLVYPATLGSLGDAAASLGLNLEVHFFAPVSLSPGLHDLHDVQGVVLPGAVPRWPPSRDKSAWRKIRLPADSPRWGYAWECRA